MVLTSNLFAGNQALQAAATHDSAHIQMGARGPHVEKIQTALNLLDGAGLKVDGAYGPGTAKAVLAYKTKRNIINRSYQTSADNIVGKMTVLQMDQELKALENTPSGRIQIIPRAHQLVARSSFDPRKLQQSDVVTNSRFSVVGSGKSTNVFPAVFNVPAVSVDPGHTVDIDIKNGKGFTLTLTEFHFATTKPAAELLVPGIAQPTSTFNMNVDNITIKARGIRWGSPLLFAQSAAKGPFATDFLIVNVNDIRPNKFNHPTIPHHHQPVSEPDEW